MFVHLSIHAPREGKTDLLIDSMHRFGAAIRDKPGCRMVNTLKDEKTGKLIGLAIWDSKEQMLAARPAMAEAVKDDPFDEWESAPPEVFLLTPAE
ncbi:MAG: hypothetical protein M5R36_25795 [Deltaproteobacteria bacterium]|nr:hypothetical protein [Deltaproteobacteria bacterium]